MIDEWFWEIILLELKDINLSRGQKDLLIDASARVARGDRVGLIGRNGAGKSSLFQLLLGQLKEDAGSVSFEIKPDQIAHLEQVLPNTEASVLAYVRSGDREWLAVQQQLDAAEDANDGMAIAQAHAALHDIDGYSIDARAAKICLGLGFDDEACRRSVKSFSGGWQMRLQLARVLMSRADLLLLDEPTNHLDIDAIVWLEDWLCLQKRTVVLISHDRDFMDNVCTKVLYLNHQCLQMFGGDYTTFARQYDLQCALEAQQQEKMQKKRAHMQSFVDRFRAKASKARQAQSRLKALEKMQVGESLKKDSPFQFEFMPPKKSATPAVVLHGDLGYGDHVVLSSIDISLAEGDRIGLLGRNGQGKSTLIKSICEAIPLLHGKVKTHPNVVLAHFSQHGLDNMDLSATPMVLMLRIDASLSEQQVRQYLGGFHFSGDRVFESIYIFSGGERARLYLAMLIYMRPNVLLLDEPTNHLDMPMREALSEALQHFTGTLMVVSHDRHFLGSTVDHLWHIHDGKCEVFSGDIDDYKSLVLGGGKVNSPPMAKPTINEKVHCQSGSKKVSIKQIQKLEKRMAKLEKDIADVEEILADQQLYQADVKDALRAAVEQHESLKQALGEAEAQWLEWQA